MKDRVWSLARGWSTSNRGGRVGRHWRECYAGALFEGVLVEGFHDLPYEEGDGLGGRRLQDRRPAHRQNPDQAAVHTTPSRRLRPGATLGRPVTRCVFVFAGGGAPAEVTLDGSTLAAAKHEVRACLHALGR